ncbi:SusC/RagA family TonB-linked outer membrane protein [Pedobacter deserti]|uniref:SusC/RagA family TonB-linked outer membrane protein n=1 Tax=Pedobacter deserti TaxID=2817382 RepID=UPI002109B394|nr:SusC/RagA family TonB-linked outer membrane protein [Pedobacter sp. SYSU D00382]
MRLTIVILLATFLHVSASSFAQKITLSKSKADLRTVLRHLSAQSGYDFIYTDVLLEKSNPVSINVKDASLNIVLEAVFENQPLQYLIEDNTVILKAKEASLIDRLVSRLQAIDVRGRVVGQTGSPIAGVTVRVKGTNKGTVSGADGRFQITNVDDNAIIVFEFVGYAPKEVKASEASGKDLNIILTETSMDLTEIQVVNTGYQKISRERATGASATITAKELQSRFTPNIIDNLEGRVAGLVNYGDRVAIRGTGTLFAESRPLLVVDGLPVEMAYEDLNPYDVETVTVLKDAAASAIYGARASNGVIIVTTKKATNLDKIDVEASSNTTVWQKRNVDYSDNWYMTPEQQVDRENQYYKWLYNTSPNAAAATTSMANSLAGTGSFELIPTPIQYDHYLLKIGAIEQSELDRRLSQYKTQNFAKDYAENILKQRVLQMHNLSIRNRTKNFQSNLVLNYRGDNRGNIHDKENQLNIFYKGAYEMTPWLTVNFTVNNISQRAIERRSNYVENIFDPFSLPAYYSLFNPDGSQANLAPSYAHYYNPYSNWIENDKALKPMQYHLLDEINLNQHKIERQNTRYHGELLFKIIPGLTFNTQYVYEVNRRSEINNSEADSYLMRLMRNAYTVRDNNGSYRYLIPQTGGRLATENSQGNFWTGRGQANFSKVIKDVHSLDVIAGLEFRETNTKGFRNLYLGWDDQLQSQSTTAVNYNDLWNINSTSFYAPGYPARVFLFNPFIQDAITLNVPGNDLTEVRRRNASGYANVTYSYDRRYNIFGSVRKDFADVYGLATEFRGAPFGSVGLSWNLNNENFMEKYTFLNLLKLRGSYGFTGNIYQGATSYMTATTGLSNNNTGLPRASIESPGNPELSWEKTKNVNLGTEFMLFDSRLRGVLDVYKKDSEKVFSNQTLEVTKGFNSLVMNMANVTNNGVELTLAYDWFRARDRSGLSWTTSGTASWNKNEVSRVEIQANGAYQVVSIGYKQGYPVRSLFSYRYAGLTAAGTQSWYTEDGRIIPDVGIQTASPGSVYYTGQADPKHTYALENQLSWKGFSLNLLMVYYGGHHMRANQVQINMSPTASPAAAPVRSWYLNAWTPTNTDTNIPGIWEFNAAGGSQPAVQNNTDIFVHAADFLKIRNFVLGYDVPQTSVSKIGLSNLRLRFQVNNLPALWKSNDIGVDPETLGIRLPTSYVFGVNFNF